MPILAGQTVTAGQLNRLQPKVYWAQGSGSIVGPATNADIPSATVTLTAETAGATYTAVCTFDTNVTLNGSGTWLGRMALDGVGQNPVSTMNEPTAPGRAASTQTYSGTLTAGSHTLKLIASPQLNQVTQGVNSSILVTIYEVV
ncbi:hypothetical protein [Streptomyces sp. NPDC014623]|uniref:hypothetical protein n=1 Tax=Streptomyces sp. NPDC014623 TaxID=3364875 RepID=UPI0036FE9DDF